MVPATSRRRVEPVWCGGYGDEVTHAQPGALSSLVLEGDGVERVPGPEVRAFLTGRMWESEGLSALPPGAIRPELMDQSMEHDMEMLGRGVTLMGLYEAHEVRDPRVVRALTKLQKAGASVRVRAGITQRLVIVDRTWAVISANVGSAGGEALVVTQPVLVRALVAHFNGLWANALSFGEAEQDTLSTERIAQTLDLLQRGLTHEAAARELGVSVRTIRRRVAAVMELFDATSGFEAGVKAAKAGWL